MAQEQLNRIVRKATSAEARRHAKIREQTDREFAPQRKPVSPTRAILAKLRNKRELLGFSLADVAKRTGIARSNLCRLEQNGQNAKLETLARYAAALGCELVIDLQASADRGAA